MAKEDNLIKNSDLTPKERREKAAKAGKASMTADGKMTVTVDVKNTGDREGAEVVQLYVADPVASIDRPVKELKGFEKISLEPGESRTVTFEITLELMSHYNSDLKLVAEPGEFVVYVGPDSRTKNSALFVLVD